MAVTLDLAILNSRTSTYAIAFARCNSDFAVARLPFGKNLKGLQAFHQLIDRALRGKEKRPAIDELTDYGHRLFNFSVRDTPTQL